MVNGEYAAPKEHKDEVSKGAPSLADNLEPCVRIRSIEFQLGRELGDLSCRPSEA